ncbi:MAG: hypothetical protein EBQ92_00105, partial [Proteobacteria bacterium]|nr:hypothetical protein [Pseudomonadota bacterium]
MPFVFNPLSGQFDQTGAGADQVNSDWNATSGVSQILNKPSLTQFQPNPDPSTDATATSLTVSGSGAFDFVYTKISSSLYQSQNLTTISFNGTAWELADNNSVIIYTSFDGPAYPWLASWPTILVTRNNLTQIVGQPLASTGATGVSVYAARADHVHPFATASQLGAAVTNASNSFTRGQTISAAANTSALTASYSVTGANTTALINLSGTWNTTGAATGMRLNITDTASNASSLLMDLQVGGTSRFSVTKAGQIISSEGLSGGGGGGQGGLFNQGGGYYIFAQGVGAGSSAFIGFANQANLTAPNGWDVRLYRDAANTLALRNSTNAQAFRLFGIFTDASNGRRLDITSTTAGVFTLTATGNGTGASGNVLKLTAPVL